MPRRQEKIICTNCRRRHRACDGNTGSDSCSECRDKGIHCDIVNTIGQHQAQHSAGPRQLRQRQTRQRPRQTATISRPEDALAVSQRGLLPRQDSPQVQQLLAGRSRLVGGYDLGTRNGAFLWAEASGNTVRASDKLDVKSVEFAEKKRESPMIAAIVKDEEQDKNILYVGRKVERQLRNGKLTESDVFILPKLALLEGYKDQVLGPRDDTDEYSRLTHDHADEILQRLQLTLARFQGQRVEVPLLFHNSDPHVFTLNTAADIIEGISAWFWDRAKCQIHDSLGCAPETTIQILEKAEVAAPVPEIWANAVPMVNRYREYLIKAGFPAVHIVSEAKCAAVLVARHLQTSDAGPEDIARAMESVLLVFDLGAGTLDLTATEVIQGEHLKIKTLVQSTGSFWGSQQINETFKHYLPEIIGPDFDRMVAQLSVGQPDKSVLLESFTRGFEVAKQEFELNSNDRVTVDYDRSDRGLPPDLGNPWIGGNYLSISPVRMQAILAEYARGLEGPIADQLQRLRRGGFLKRGRRVEMYCVGGGSRSQFVINHLKETVTSASVKTSTANTE
jgi:hypothetical protein